MYLLDPDQWNHRLIEIWGVITSIVIWFLYSGCSWFCSKMAEQLSDPLRYLTEKLFCPKCGSVFKNPKQLSCLHSVCLLCLEAVQETCGQHVIIKCPCCEKKTTIQGEMAADLPNSPYVASLEVLAQIMSQNRSCPYWNVHYVKQNQQP